MRYGIALVRVLLCSSIFGVLRYSTAVLLYTHTPLPMMNQVPGLPGGSKII